jgi:hypothetical protein
LVNAWRGSYRNINFHSTPGVFKPLSGVSQGGRREFDVVPINKSLPLDGTTLTTHQTFLDPKTVLTTSMETEAEFTLKNLSDERQLEHMIGLVSKMKDDPVLLEKTLGKGWSIEGPLDKWDVTNKDGGVIVEKTDWDKYGTPQDRPELKRLGFGTPGMMEDVYLHIGKEGVVRERRNHLGDGVITVKGTHRRKEGDEHCMTRYCRLLKP